MTASLLPTQAPGTRPSHWITVFLNLSLQQMEGRRLWNFTPLINKFFQVSGVCPSGMIFFIHSCIHSLIPQMFMKCPLRV